jgi:hypothetical protein
VTDSLSISPAQPRPFTYHLTYVLCAFPVAYLIANLIFVAKCVPVADGATLSSACTMPRVVSLLDTILPAIWRPISKFELAGHSAQALIVRNSLEFIWGTAICTVIIISFACLVWILSLSAAKKHRAQAVIYDQNRFLGPKERHTLTKGPRLLSYIGFFAPIIFLAGDPALMSGTLSGNRTTFYAQAVALTLFLFSFIVAIVLGLRAWLLRTARNGQR